jgi:hypothetical protein
LLHAIHSPFYRRMLTKTILSFHFKNPYKKSANQENSSLFMKSLLKNWKMRVENQIKTRVREDSSLCPETSTKNAAQEFHPRKLKVNLRYPRSNSAWDKSFLARNGKIGKPSSNQFCGSGIFIPDRNFFHPQSGDPNFFYPDPGSASKDLSILTQKMVSKLLEIWSGFFIPYPDPEFFPIPDPGSRGQNGTGSRIRNTGLYFE